MVFFSAALAGFACWSQIAGTGAERLAFTGVLRGFAKPPFFQAGRGTRADPWAVRTLAAMPMLDSRKAPVVVSMGDDPDGVFQSSPPSPVDLAVVLKNLRRLGAQQAAIAMVLAWDNPDTVALKGLELVLNDFQRLVHAAPLTRGTVGQPMPPAFRRASLAMDCIQGDRSRLPLINRVGVADVIFGGECALAGFSTLDAAESGSGGLPMLARWEDDARVVLAFPLLVVLARHDLPVAGVQVKLGQFIQLGPVGPVIPIDQDGRLARWAAAVASRGEVPAAAVIDGPPEIFPAAPGLIVLRDDQSAAPRATRGFSATLTSAITAIDSEAGVGPPVKYQRLTVVWEVSLILLAGVLLTVIAGRPGLQRQLGLGLLTLAAVAAQWLALGVAQVWLPGIPLLAAILAAWLVIVLVGKWLISFTPRAMVPAPPVRHQVAAASCIPVTWRAVRSVTMHRGPDGIHEVERSLPSRKHPTFPFCHEPH